MGKTLPPPRYTKSRAWKKTSAGARARSRKGEKEQFFVTRKPTEKNWSSRHCVRADTARLEKVVVSKRVNFKIFVRMRHARVCFCWNALKCSEETYTHRAHNAVDRRRFCLFVQKTLNSGGRFASFKKKNFLHSFRCAIQSNLSRSLLLFLRGRRASVCALCSVLSLCVETKKARSVRRFRGRERERD